MAENDINTNENPSTDATATPVPQPEQAAAEATAPEAAEAAPQPEAAAPVFQQAAPQAPQYAPVQTAAPAQPATTGSWGWIVLGIFIPLVGLILFLVWRKDKPLSAKASGIGAIIGAALSIIASIITAIALVPAMVAATDSLYDYASTPNTTIVEEDTGTSVEDEYADIMEGYLEVPGSSILPELGAGEYAFEPESCYWINENPGDGDWLYGYWMASATDPDVIEFWGAKDADDEEGVVVGTITADELKANFEAAGWTGEVELSMM